MAVYSMTGYASAQSGNPESDAAGEPQRDARPGLGLEIRSVNSRFLDLAFKLPDDLRGTEPALRELLVSRLKRGKVEIRAWVEGRADAGPRQPSMGDIQKLVTLQDNVRAWLPGAAPLSVAEVLQITNRPQSRPGELHDGLLELAKLGLEQLIQARAREGERLAFMLLDHLKQLRTLAKEAQPLIPKLVEQQRLRFIERWNEALSDSASATGNAITSDMARDRALTEATAFAIRIDVAEELTRLDSHLVEIERLVKKGAEVGKRLDFLIQELHREANTLGSKSSSLELTRISVDMKVLIEQMREQVQNIE